MSKDKIFLIFTIFQKCQNHEEKNYRQNKFLMYNKNVKKPKKSEKSIGEDKKLIMSRGFREIFGFFKFCKIIFWFYSMLYFT